MFTNKTLLTSKIILLILFFFSIVVGSFDVQAQTTFDRDLYLGVKSEEVSVLQRFLVEQGVLEDGLPLGYFGQKTRDAVKKFQEKQKIAPASGFFGPTTRAKANAVKQVSTPKVDIAVPSPIADYPFVLKPISQTTLKSLNKEFNVANKKKQICTELNEFGLTSRNRSCDREILDIVINDEDKIVAKVKDWVLKNSKFTGVTNISDLIVESTTRLNLNSQRKFTGLIVYFRRQNYSGLSVEGPTDRLVVYADAVGVARVDGFQFPSIKVPLEPKVSSAFARRKFVGKTLTSMDISGNPVNYTVEQKDLGSSGHKVIFVRKTSSGLEFRLAWKVSVGQPTMWSGYVDAITGEELDILQEFVS